MQKHTVRARRKRTRKRPSFRPPRDDLLRKKREQTVWYRALGARFGGCVWAGLEEVGWGRGGWYLVMMRYWLELGILILALDYTPWAFFLIFFFGYSFSCFFVLGMCATCSYGDWESFIHGLRDSHLPFVEYGIWASLYLVISWPVKLVYSGEFFMSVDFGMGVFRRRTWMIVRTPRS